MFGAVRYQKLSNSIDCNYRLEEVTARPDLMSDKCDICATDLEPGEEFWCPECYAAVHAQWNKKTQKVCDSGDSGGNSGSDPGGDSALKNSS